MKKYIPNIVKTIIKKKIIERKAKGIEVCEGNYFEFLDNLHLDNYIFFGRYGYYHAGGGLIIKQGCCFGPKVTILTENHNYDSTNLEELPFDNVMIKESVVVNENVWVGYGALILPGVTIGEGAIVAANSVITKDVPNFALVAGNPAKIVKYRNKEKYYELKNDDKIHQKLKYTDF